MGKGTLLLLLSSWKLRSIKAIHKSTVVDLALDFMPTAQRTMHAILKAFIENKNVLLKLLDFSAIV